MKPAIKARRAVVFDCDGTLFDSLPLVLNAISHAILPFAKVPPREEIMRQLGGPPARFMPGLVGDLRHVPEALRRFDAYHREQFGTLQPFPGARATLETLRAGHAPTAIWTGRDRKSTEQMLHEHKLAALFDTIVCGDDLPTHKPDPEGLRKIMRQLGTTTDTTLFIGDSTVDVLAGHACGVKTLLIRQMHEADDAGEPKAWREAATPEESYALALQWAGMQ